MKTIWDKLYLCVCSKLLVTVLNLHEIMMKPEIKLTQFQKLESIEADMF